TRLEKLSDSFFVTLVTFVTFVVAQTGLNRIGLSLIERYWR
ncbi:MAG: hypothetical protein RLY70_1918, partial [Planctomycetota bacterium]